MLTWWVSLSSNAPVSRSDPSTDVQASNGRLDVTIVEPRSVVLREGLEQQLMGYEIDILTTPDPIEAPGVHYLPVFDYELVLAVPNAHPLALPIAKEVSPGQ